MGDLQTFTQNYLDPQGQFHPHIQFFMGALYYSIQDWQKSLEILETLTASPQPRWRAMAHLARGIIYQEHLAAPEKAREEYTTVQRLAPQSLEATEAQRRLRLPS